MRIGVSIRVAFLCLLFSLGGRTAVIAQTNNLAAEIPGNFADGGAASNDTVRAYLQLQEQLHATQLAIERTRHDAEEANTRSAEALAAQLRLVEQKLSTQRAGEARFIVYILSGFAGLSFFAVVITAYFQWRTVKRFADFTAALPLGRSFAAANAGTLTMGDSVSSDTVERSSNRLLGAVERLEKRILELEHAAAPALKNAVENKIAGNGSNAREIEPPATAEPLDFSEKLEQPDRIKDLLEKGQVLLNEDKPEAAVEAFDLILALDSDNAEALVKKGAALEKLRKLQEAIECYDRAIAADSSMTIAYLHKGGLFNRLERFGEAVECYEKALRTQEKQSAA